ncbi:TY5A [Symbiodinium sp. KB8]|nr:TY5A [Symbiodinium sp. KB8]
MPVYKQVHSDHRIDLIGVNVSMDRIIPMCRDFGLSVLQPLTFEDSVRAVYHFKPLFVMIKWPGPDTEQDELKEKCQVGAEVCVHQSESGRLFLCEAPPFSSAWTASEKVRELLHLKDVTTNECDAAAYGAETEDNQPASRAHRWVTNSAPVAGKLTRKLAEELQMYCQTGGDDNQSDDHDYCDGLLYAILQGLQEEARRVFPSRFNRKPHDVLFARPVPNTEAWNLLLDDLEAKFANTHKKPFYVSKGDPFHKSVLDLVPWEVTKMQAAWLPQARRLPQEFPYTHRGAALRLTTGELQLEAEDLASISHPKQRFIRAVRVAIFFYGHPKQIETEEPGNTGEEAEPGPERPPAGDLPGQGHGFRQLVPGLDTEIWFEGNVDKKLQSSLARLHVNMGHSSKAELTRMMAAAGTLNARILTALDNLRCGSCIRTKMPIRPPPSGVPENFCGFFGEVIQADIVYIRTIEGSNHAVLGLTCESTSYHTAKIVENRSPALILKTLLELWYRPLGLPVRFRCDPGGEFGGEVIQFHTRHGVLHDVIPAEAHHRLGKIERRNALLRSIVERIVDEKGIATADLLDQCLAAATHTMNASTYSFGRSPYQAVFGKIPRPLGDLLSDPLSLVISPEQQALRPEVLRADALKALAEHSASTSLKRALLRKTRHQQDLHQLQPGQPIAFWRWSGRSRQHKRGAWSLARFVSVDPDGKSVWAQINTTTIKIAGNQIRTACGWESWSPTREDIAILKDAEKNLRQDLWEDAREEPPREEQEVMKDLARIPLADSEVVLPLRLPTASASTPPTPRRSQQTTVQQEQPQTNVQQGVQQTTVQQEQHQTNVQQGVQHANVYQKYVDNRSVTMNVPLSPVPPTPRNRRGRSRTPSRRSQSVPRTPRGATAAEESPAPAAPTPQGLQPAGDETPAPVTPGALPFSPGVPETPPFSARMPGTPDYTGLDAEELHALPELPPSAPVSEGQQDTAEHDMHHESGQQPPEAVFPPAGASTARDSSNTSGPAPAASTASGLPPQGSTSGNGLPMEGPLPILPLKRPADALYTTGAYLLNYDDFGEAEAELTENVTINEARLPFASETFYTCYLSSQQRTDELNAQGIFEDTTRADETTDEENLPVSNNRAFSRQELKQLDREIPWKEVVKLPKAAQEKYQEAVVTEHENWLRWGGLRPLSRKEAKAVFADRALAKRILRSRSAFRDKNKGIGELRAKCRVVIIGCADPDLFQLSRDSPTPSRLSEALVLAFATAGANQEVCNERGKWLLWIADAKSAFLQGEQNREERGGPLFMLPPQDPVVAATGTFSAELYEVLGNGYGLPDAPRVWNRKVNQRLVEKGFKQHGFDRCFYYYVDSENRLRAVMIVHVDDFMCAYHEDFDFNIIADLFVWGSTHVVSEGKPGTYRGKEISLVNLEGRVRYKITQTAFIDGMASGKLPKGRSREGEALTTEEWKDFRSVAGSLQWLASQTRPEVSAVVSLSTRGQATTVLDLKRLYETVEFLKATRENGIVYQDVPVDKATTIVTFTDSSWANTEQLKSQYGVLVLIAPSQVSEVSCKASLLDWKSGRSTRVCRSTLAAEASAADEGADRATFLNLSLSELLYNEPAFTVGSRLHNLHVTDAKSLYDCVVAENPNVSDKRSLVNIRSIQQTINPKQMHWVPTNLMRADGLTKLDSTLLVSTAEWLQNPTSWFDRTLRFKAQNAVR